MTTRPIGLERFEFYERAKKAFVIIQTSDIRPYANIFVKKGVINHAD
ncbi:RbsD/FucU domain-containing protein [Marinomonas pontica]